MKHNRLAIAALAPVLILVGCATPLERRQASGGFDYLEQPAPTPLVVPAGLDAPRVSREFDVPPLGSSVDRDVVGPRLDVRPPLQVLPLAPGTRLQDSVDSVTVLVESNQDDLDLAHEIHETLLKFLSDQSIGVATDSNGVIVTDWIENEEVIGKSWFRDKVYQIRQRYEFDTVVKDHGRSGSITIELVDHEEGLDGIDDSIVLTDADRRRYAIDMLNNAIAYMNFERKQRQATQELLNGRGIKTVLGFDSDENTAFIAEASFDQVWRRMDHVLPLLGFEVRDLDQQLATYFVDFESDSGFWASLWGDNDALPLEEGPYQIRLEPMGERTAITVLDNEAKPLPTETVTQMYNRFADLLKKEMRELQ
ncbi:outer membrane protein assembly factor BamC [Ferrimonas balearica]|uniref:outer membrane protein assembly factor BamC n=1 Tax=Ferrimonas balearica TaxID=44012 RepID=UPI001C994A00|nr:outer membrane protein assembly factor BamC [Ferrimonas balearica]MBY5921054.1 outer membrane protein assembly factor BamC [Ferrimonas balearica]MBY5996261.1 outer membrane protein assembly factor BamC [Ferrimonas balearica]